jgi:ABC-type cobalamin/Fe3+-siderophores transport system ATPase subunit
MQNHHYKNQQIYFSKNKHLLIMGPNGMGKTTLIESIADGTAEGVKFLRN